MTSLGKARGAIVFGDPSTEHGVSSVAAGAILGALDPDRYEVLPVGITRAGRWVPASGDAGQFAVSERRLPETTAEQGSADVVDRLIRTAFSRGTGLH